MVWVNPLEQGILCWNNVINQYLLSAARNEWRFLQGENASEYLAYSEDRLPPTPSIVMFKGSSTSLKVQVHHGVLPAASQAYALVIFYLSSKIVEPTMFFLL